VTGSPATTDAAGLASVTVTLGTTAQALTVTALATGVVETATFNLTAQAGPAAAVSKVTTRTARRARPWDRRWW